MAVFASRDLHQEASKHFRGTPEGRLVLALRLGRQALQLFLAANPASMTEHEAREILRRNKHRGRRPSRAAEAPRP